MAMGSTKPLTQMSTINIYWGGKGGRSVVLTALPPSCTVCNDIWEPQPSETSGPVQACIEIALAFSFVYKELTA